jgi:hypothetical protein
VPVEHKVAVKGTKFEQKFAAYSINVLEVDVRE